jgi:tRNA(fMet)-specific endonuclease VapC
MVWFAQAAIVKETGGRRAFSSGDGAKMPVLPYEKSAAEWFAQERARLTQIGRPPSYPDGQIAAVAAVNNLILVTRNTADFAHFAGLRLENWFEAAA